MGHAFLRHVEYHSSLVNPIANYESCYHEKINYLVTRLSMIMITTYRGCSFITDCTQQILVTTVVTSYKKISSTVKSEHCMYVCAGNFLGNTIVC